MSYFVQKGDAGYQVFKGDPEVGPGTLIASCLSFANVNVVDLI